MKSRPTTHSRSLRGRLLFHAILVVGLALCVAGSAITLLDFADGRRQSEENMRIWAENLALNLEVAVAIRDSEGAEDLLETLQVDEKIVHVCVLIDGDVFATYKDPVAMDGIETPEDRSQWYSGGLLFTQREFGDIGGKILVVRNVSGLTRDAWTQAGIYSLVVFCAMVLAFFFTARLQARLIHPIVHLSAIATQVTTTHEYSARAKKQSDDEIGALTDAFNEMLRQIETRDEALLRYQQDLENRVNVRTRELQEAKDAAVASSRAKSYFLANMSHEIRTPMTAILGYADILLDPTQSPENRVECVQTVRRNGKHLLAIINDILDLSKIEAGKMAIEVIECHPWKVLEDVASLMNQRAVEKGLEFRIENLTPLPERILTDPTRLRQILVNLVGNAVKFTEEGEIIIQVQVAHLEAQRPILEFRITDTGIGMTPDQLRNVFSAFSQADDSTTRKFGGTGLGLVISQKLSRMLGGDIRVRSNRHEGSTFSATIAYGPVPGAPMVDRPGELTDSEKSEGTRHDSLWLPMSSGFHVLLAEDGPDNQRLIEFVLAKSGIECTIVENGRLAFDRAFTAWKRGEPYNAILMDMQMPEMDGYEATSLLRSKGYPGPIIALTAHAMAGDREKCLKAGCDDYATKPIDRQRMVETVLRAIERWGNREQHPGPTESQGA